MEQLGINLPGLVSQVINFALLLVLLRVFAYKPVLSILDERAARIREGVDKAEEAKRQAAAIDEQSAERRLESLKQAQEIIARANQTAERIYQEAEERARLLGDEYLAKSRAEIERDRQKAVADIRSEMADLAIYAASRVIRSSLDPKDHYRLVEEALTEAEKSKLS